MAIIISQNGKNAKKIEQTSFDVEDRLQQYIYDNPTSIPLYEISEDINLLILAREFVTESGPIDALGVDESGNLYIIETKLYKNPDKRTVVAQALDYGASLWRHSVDFDSFLIQLNTHVQQQFQMTLQDKLADYFVTDDITGLVDSMRKNLAGGNLKFVVLMDRLHDRLKDLIVYVNQNSQFDLYAVELEYYKHESFEILIPKIFGAEVKKQVSSLNASNAPKYKSASNEVDFWQAIQTNIDTDILTDTQANALRQLAATLNTLAGQTNGTIQFFKFTTVNQSLVKLALFDDRMKKSISLNSDGSMEFYKWDKSGAQIDFINELLSQLISKQILKRTQTHTDAGQWFISLKAKDVSNEEITAFVQTFKELTDGL